MKILMINVVCGIKSTGRICTDIADVLAKTGNEVKIAYGREMVPKTYQKYAVRIGTEYSVKLHGIKSRLFDKTGYGSRRDTERFIEWIKQYNPDVIHLHNLHGYYINIEILFDYLRVCQKKIIWTLHDCWAFTGHCTYFEYANCDRWKTGCGNCPQIKEYPSSLFIDRSLKNYYEKLKLFTNVSNLTIVTPSIWLEQLVKHSFLKEYKVVTIHNGINTKVFKPINSDIKERMGISNCKVVLGVAAIWNRRKGLDDLKKIASLLPDNYRVVIVGVSQNQTDGFTDKMIAIEKTNNTEELAELYSMADYYVNPTLEDNYPTTNLEAYACGTPVITYRTGGSPESADPSCVVDKGNYYEIVNIILHNNARRPLYLDVTIQTMVDSYINLYKKDN